MGKSFEQKKSWVFIVFANATIFEYSHSPGDLTSSASFHGVCMYVRIFICVPMRMSTYMYMCTHVHFHEEANHYVTWLPQSCSIPKAGSLTEPKTYQRTSGIILLQIRVWNYSLTFTATVGLFICWGWKLRSSFLYNK